MGAIVEAKVTDLARGRSGRSVESDACYAARVDEQNDTQISPDVDIQCTKRGAERLESLESAGEADSGVQKRENGLLKRVRESFECRSGVMD